MKIAHVTATFPPDIGGMGQVAFNEASGLSKRGHDVTVFTVAYPHTKYSDKSAPFRIVRENASVKGGAAGLIPGIREKLKSFDLVHLHFPFYGGAEWVWSSGVPYVVTYHMDAKPTKIYQQMVKFFYDKILSVKILQKAKRVFLVDDLHEFEWKSRLFPSQMTLLRNGVDTDIFKPKEAILSKYTLEKLTGKKVFIFVGNFMPVKGLSVVLRVFSKLSEDCHLMVVGSGYDEHIHRKEADKLGLHDRIHWLGACYKAEVLADYYNLADAVVVPSYSESFSLVAAEALACGKPVIASDIPGIRGRVIEGETGFLFKKGSDEELAEAVRKFLNLSPVQKSIMSKNARLLAEMKFSLREHLDVLEKIYKLVV